MGVLELLRQRRNEILNLASKHGPAMFAFLVRLLAVKQMAIVI